MLADLTLWGTTQQGGNSSPKDHAMPAPTTRGRPGSPSPTGQTSCFRVSDQLLSTAQSSQRSDQHPGPAGAAQLGLTSIPVLPVAGKTQTEALQAQQEAGFGGPQRMHGK